MIIMLFEGLSGLFLVLMALIFTANPNLLSIIIFKVIPIFLGMPLLLIAFGRLMGRPV